MKRNMYIERWRLPLIVNQFFFSSLTSWISSARLRSNIGWHRSGFINYSIDACLTWCLLSVGTERKKTIRSKLGFIHIGARRIPFRQRIAEQRWMAPICGNSFRHLVEFFFFSSNTENRGRTPIVMERPKERKKMEWNCAAQQRNIYETSKRFAVISFLLCHWAALKIQTKFNRTLVLELVNRRRLTTDENERNAVFRVAQTIGSPCVRATKSNHLQLFWYAPLQRWAVPAPAILSLLFSSN